MDGERMKGLGGAVEWCRGGCVWCGEGVLRGEGCCYLPLLRVIGKPFGSSRQVATSYCRAIGVMSQTSSLNGECPIIRKATLKPQLQMVINCMEFTMNLLSFI